MEKQIIAVDDADVSLEDVLEAMKTDRDDAESVTMAESLFAEAKAVARPKALYAPIEPVFVSEKVILNGITISERFVFDKLSAQERVVAYVATCGAEADEWAKSKTDIFEQFTADAIKQLYLNAVMKRLFDETAKYFPEEKFAVTINPGSLKEWPLAAQRQLFAILGGVTGDIGVTLSGSCLMTPNKSVSGIMFASDEHYVNCQLCPKDNCPGRRAKFSVA